MIEDLFPCGCGAIPTIVQGSQNNGQDGYHDTYHVSCKCGMRTEAFVVLYYNTNTPDDCKRLAASVWNKAMQR